ncbi:hypothetical protein PRIPAC_83341 [Pristionchus pacificus]|nr:hypothetical protein PRIPAC_83341 [Pristionchus pacificus]
MILVAFRAFGAASLATFKVLIQVILADLFRGRALGIAMMLMAACDIVSGMVTGIVSSWIVSSGMPWQTGLLAGPLLSIPLLTCLFFASRSFYAEKRSTNLNRIVSNAFGILSIKSYLLWASAVSLGMFQVKAIISLNSFAMMIGMIVGLPPIIWLAQVPLFSSIHRAITL